MNNLKYYKDITNDFILCYESKSEFFVQYIDKLGEWKDCNISFKAFSHDYEYIEVTKDEVSARTNGNLPDYKYEKYIELINSLRGK